MSLTSPVPDERGIAFTATGLYLHPRCVWALFVRLARDVHELENPAYYRRRREGPPR